MPLLEENTQSEIEVDPSVLEEGGNQRQRRQMLFALALLLVAFPSVLVEAGQAITEVFEPLHLTWVQGLRFQVWQGQLANARTGIAHRKQVWPLSRDPGVKAREAGHVAVRGGASKAHLFIQVALPRQDLLFRHQRDVDPGSRRGLPDQA